MDIPNSAFGFLKVAFVFLTGLFEQGFS